MSFMSNYYAELKKLKKKEEELDSKGIAPYRDTSANKAPSSSEGSFMDRYYEELSKVEAEEEDVAPVLPFYTRLTGNSKADEDTKGLDFFKKGLFKDGYDFGDVTKTILGTAGDVGLGMVKGAGSIAEGLADVVSYGVAGIADKAGANRYADEVRERAKENFIADILLGGATDYVDKYSALGKTSDAVSEGIGQAAAIMATGGLGAAAGLGTVGTTILTTGTMGLSGVGSGMTEAYNSGADDEEARTYGIISGAADAVTELIFGGMGKAIKATGMSVGLSSADDMLAKKVSGMFSSQIAKNFAEFGIKAGAEGFEEVLAGIAQAAGKKATYMSEEEFSKILQDENLLEQFVVGSVTSGIAQSGIVPGTVGGSLKEANKTGRDFVSGLTGNEQKVVDKVYRDFLQQKKDGKTDKSKDELYNEVLERMEKGYISTDTIEEVLAGEKYKPYKDTLDEETAIREELKAYQTEYDNLSKKDTLTLEETVRKNELTKLYADAKAKLDDADRIGKRDSLKAQLDKEVYELTKGDKLRESFFEVVRSKQKYEADLSKYEGKAREVIKQVMDSKLVDNSNQTHEFWDLMANLSARGDTTISVANDEQILELVKKQHEADGLEFDESRFKGQRIDGFTDGKRIVLNAKTERALNFVVGHEITHNLEKTKHYGSLQKLLIEFAGDDYTARFGERKGQYANKFAQDEKFKSKVDMEVTGDLVGDYLFTNKDFVKHLAKDRNVFQRVWDEIKYFCKIATAGSEQKRQLEQVKREFERAWRETQKNTADGGANYSISRTQAMSWKEQIDGALYDGKNIRRNDTLVVGNPADTAVRNDIENKPLAIPLRVLTKASSGKDISHSIKRGKLAKLDEGIKNAPITIVNPDRNAIVYVTDIKQGGLPVIAAFDMNATFDGDEVHQATSIHLQVDTQALLESLPESATVYVRKNELDPVGATNNLRGLAAKIKFIEANVTQKGTEVNGKFSVSDADLENAYNYNIESGDMYGAQMMVEQAAQNAGYTIEGYHGTDRDFWTFSLENRGRNGEMLGVGYYFTHDKDKAAMFSGRTGKVKHVFLDIKKPTSHELMTISQKEWGKFLDYAEQHRDEYIDSVWKGNSFNKEFEIRDMLYYDNDAEFIKAFIDTTAGRNATVAEGYLKMLKDSIGYDGLIYENGDSKVYVAFTPEQIKSADTVTYDDNGNMIPLSERFKHSNPDIRFSLSEAVEETKDLVAVHNLHASELVETLKLSGLPSPSVAIIKAKDGHDKYGDVSLIMPKDAIDPQANKANRIYGSDAWTPTRGNAPVEYEVNYEIQRQFERTVEELAKNVAGGIFSRSSVLGMAGIEDSTDMNLKEVANKIADYDAVRAAYVAENGGNVDVAYRTKVFDNYGNDALGGYIDKVGEQEVARLAAKMMTGERLTAEEIETAKDSMMENWVAKKEYVLKKKPELREARIAKFRENLSDIRVEDFVRHAWDFYENTGATSDEVDYGATGNNLRSAADRAEVAAWVEEKLQGLLSEPAIYNGKDPFTPGGKRRSFKEMHWEYTAENIVRAMNNADARGANVWNVSGEAIIATATPEYQSIDEVRADKDRLLKAESDVYDQIKEDVSSKLEQVTKDIVRTTKHQSDNQYDEEQIIGRVIMEAAQGTKTTAAVKKVFQNNGYRIGDAQAKAVLELFDHASKVPTGYFEAKPQRVVGFDEVAVFVIPYDADVKLKQELLNRGYAIAEYDPKVDGDRTKVLNQFEEYKFSLSNVGETPKRYGTWNVYAKDMMWKPEEIAPVGTVSNMESVSPVMEEPLPDAESYSDLLAKKADLESKMMEAVGAEDFDTFNQINEEYSEVMARIEEMEQHDQERVDSLDDAEAPPEMEAPYYGEVESTMPENPFDDRDWYTVGNQKVKAYMYENPEVKPFFQEEALKMLGELGDTTRGERWYNDQLYYESGGEAGFGGTKRHTSASMEELLDAWGMSYADIEKGLNAIIEDHGAENIAAAKKLEFMINDRLLNGYKDFYTNGHVAPNRDYIKLLNEKQVTEYSQEAFARFMENADAYAPLADDIGPVKATVMAAKAPVVQTTEKYEAIKPKREAQPRMARATPEEQQRIAEILDEEPSVANRKNRAWAKFRANVLDKGSVFEDLSLKTKNRTLMGKWNYMLYSEARAQRLMGNGTGHVKSLNAIREEVGKTGKTKQFYQYLYHKHNIDRMTLEERYEDAKNKPVFGNSVTADDSRKIVDKLEAQNPKFKRYAKDVYGYMTYLRQQLVDGGVISQETAKLWAEMYPNYVPIRRAGDTGLNINVPLDTRKTGVNAPVKKATGGSRDILPLFDTMGQRTIQTYRAIAKNSFGVELKDTLRSTIGNEALSVDDVIDSIDMQDGLLHEGKNGQKPTFTVFENGEKVTFEIDEDMYDALKPVSEGLSYTNKVLNTANNIHRGLLTEYNPVFLLTNAVKDTQDVLINSQHPWRTYAKIPEAYAQLFKKGYWYQEYMDNGGEQNTYFDNQTSTFKEESSGLKKVVKLPLDAISAANNFIEMTPRLAEYIASREAGRSVEVAMLDAARVTTNFVAGGDLTKLLNRNGVTFLNASVQGAMQQVRNVREANANGLKGWANLATKFAVAGLPAILLNNLVWDDDEEYEELSDYVKQNYYIVGKYGDGNFIRIPKGRTLAVIQEGIEQISNALTGNDEVDLANFLELVVTNLAPNNPLDNNIIAPIMQAVKNETWYGEDLVPTRLQDLPAGEQFDESTDSVSKWLGEKLNISPVKINYLLNQYSGGVGDVLLPMITPKAERGNNTLLGNMIAPLKDKFSTDAVMNNQNVSDFYDLKDELTTKAKASAATDEDKLMYKYINSVNAELSELYKQKREIQNSKLSNEAKYSQAREIQEQIVDLMKSGMSAYTDINIDGEYATVGDRYFKQNEEGEWEKLSDEQATKYTVTNAAGDSSYATDGTNHYRWYEPEEGSDSEPGWKKITEDQLEKQEEVTSALRISPEEYWGNKEEYDYAYEYPESYAVAKAVGGYDAYRQYSSELYDIKADKDEYGKSISGSRKEKVQAYINSLNADYYTKLILFKSEYTSYDDENYEIVEYLNNRDDISFEEMRNILIKLGFEVDSQGNISW